jgi:hypothetical protein
MTKNKRFFTNFQQKKWLISLKTNVMIAIICRFRRLYVIFTNFHKKTGVDVMITIFCDFRHFSAKQLAFFSKTNVMNKILHYLALLWVKNANFFAEFFGENIFKIITSVPGWFSYHCFLQKYVICVKDTILTHSWYIFPNHNIGPRPRRIFCWLRSATEWILRPNSSAFILWPSNRHINTTPQKIGKRELKLGVYVFPESQVSKLQITERYVTELHDSKPTYCRTKLPNRHIVELISCQTDILLNW